MDLKAGLFIRQKQGSSGTLKFCFNFIMAKSVLDNRTLYSVVLAQESLYHSQSRSSPCADCKVT